MTVINKFIAYVFSVAVFSLVLASRAANFELLSGNNVRVGLGAGAGQRITVDVSSNLVNWNQITNVAATSGQVAFANDPSQADPMRFFRLSDADDSFAISGYVNGGNFFGGMGGVTVTENVTGTSVMTDANGFFHFDERFARTNLPVWLTASAEGMPIVQRPITPADAGTFSVLDAPLGFPPSFDFRDRIFRFKVTGGPRAGLEYAMRFYNGQMEITGGISAEGIFGAANEPVTFLLNLPSGSHTLNQFYLWPKGTNAAGAYGWFSGIPGTNGTLAGNGTVTIERSIVSPTSLSGLAFSIGPGEVRFIGNSCQLKWDGIINTNQYNPSRYDNFWEVSLFDNGTSRGLELYFSSKTNGTFTLEPPSGPVVTGDMRQIP